MAILSMFDFDSQTSGAAVTASAPWAKLGATTMLASPAAAVHGALGGRIADPSSQCAMEWTEASTDAARVLDVYVTPHAIAGPTYVMAYAAGAASLASARINADGTVAIRNGTIAVATSSATLDLGETYRIAWRVSSAGQELRVYEGESEAPMITLTGAVTDATHTKLLFGLTALSSGAALDIDTIRIADDWLGPVNPTTPLDMPVLTVGAIMDASGPEAADGSVQVSWPGVAGAAGYQRCILDGHVASGFTEQAAATSPTVFSGLEPGQYTVAVRAKA